jgi:hypothetical protein
MKRAALVFAVLSVLVIADGIYLELANNQQGCGCNGDSGALFGGGINISTGAEVLIGGVLLLIATGLFWGLSLLRRRGGLAAANGRAQAGQSPAKTEVSAAAPAQVSNEAGKESGDQR